MCPQPQKLRDLPDVLQDLVCMFAWNIPKKQIQPSLDIYAEINTWRLPFWFLHKRVWSWHYRNYMNTPLKEFSPIEYFSGEYRQLFNQNAVYSLLIGLDFRLKNVRLFGNRTRWETRILQDWRVMESLSSFYKMLLHSKRRVLRKSTCYSDFYDAVLI